MLDNKKNMWKKLVAGTLVILLALATMPLGGLLNTAKAQIPSQFNTNLSVINSRWATMDATRSDNQLIFNTTGQGMATIMINITDTDLQTAIDTSTVSVSTSINGSVSGIEQPPLEGEPDHTSELFISFGVDAGSTYAAEPSGSDSYISLGDGSFTLDTGSVVIPAGTRWIMVKAAVTTPNQLEATPVAILTNSVTIIEDTQQPTMESSYNSEWSNQDIVVTITAADNIGVKGIYDGSDTLLTTGSSYAYTVTDEGENTATFYTIDYAENISETLTVTVDNIDRTAPYDISAPTYDGQWTNAAVQVSFDELTQTEGTSPLSYAVSLDGGSSFNTFEGNVYNLTENGEVTSIYKIVDAAGNESSNTVTATTKYDSEAPSIDDIEVTRVSGRNDYDVTVSDLYSGIAQVKYAAGFRDVSYFASGGTDITATLTFSSTTSQQFTVFAKDNAGNTSIAQINELNILPSIEPIADVTINEDESLEIALVVSDDTTTAENLIVTVSSSDTAVQPDISGYYSEGTVYIMIDPADNANTGEGSLTMTVNVEDADADSVNTQFSLTVTPVNDAPDAAADSASTQENTSVTIAVLANDTDVEEDTLSIYSYEQPDNGTVTQSGDELIYTPDTDWAGEDSFVYYVSDSNDIGLATVTVTVTNQNDAPVANNDSATVNEDVELVIDVLANDSDADLGIDPEETLTVTLSTENTASLGSVEVNANVITYTPNANAYGQDTFDYILTDKAGLFDTATVTVKINSINDTPTLSGYPTDYTVPEDSIGATFTFTIADVETAVSNLMVQAVSQNPVLISNEDISMSVNPETGLCTVTLDTVPDKNGTLEIKLLVSDGIASDFYMMPVTISPGNDAPVGVNDDMTQQWIIFEDVAKQLDLSVLTQNDTDIDGDELTVTGVSSVSSGTLVQDSGEVYTYTSAAGFSGNVTFTYTLSDGSATATAVATIKVLAADDAPILVVDPLNDNDCVEDLFENNLTVYCSDEDTDFADLVVTAESSNEILLSSDNITIINNGGGEYELSLAPTEHGNGTTDITVYLSDGTTEVSQTFTYTITPAQDAPVAVNDTYAIAQGRTEYIIPIANDYDYDNEPLDLAAEDSFTLPEAGTLVRSARGFKYSAPADANGTYTFTYTITDGIDTATATVTLLVGNYDDLNIPEISEIDNVDTIINSTLADIPFTATHTNGIASVTVVSSDQTIIQDSDLNIIDYGDGDYALELALMPDVTGVTDITITVTSTNGRVAVRQFSVNVYPDNQTPVAVDDTLTGAIEDTDFLFTAAQLLANDTDIEDDSLSVVGISIAGETSAYITGNGTSYTYHPAPNEFGSVTLYYWITDGNSVSAPGTVTLVIEGIDDLPDGDSDYYLLANETGSESMTILLADILSNDDDVDGDTLYFYQIETYPQYGTLSFDINGDIVYTRTSISPRDYGNDYFRYFVADKDPEDPDFNVSEDVELASTVVTIQDEYPSDFYVYNIYRTCDEDSDPFTISVSFAKAAAYSGTFILHQPSPSKGTVVIDTNSYSDGSLLSMTYQPDPEATGYDTFTYTIEDTDTGRTKSATITVFIKPVNDAPYFTLNPETDWTRDEDGSITLSVEFADDDNPIEDISLSVYITNQNNAYPIALTSSIEVTRDPEDLSKATAVIPFVKDANGTFSVAFEITDGIDYTTVYSDGTVTPVDDPPVTPDLAVDAIEEDTSVMTDIMTLVYDVDNTIDELVLSITTNALHGTASIVNGEILYAPDFNYYGGDSIVYRVSSLDGTVYSEGTIYYTVDSVNDVPYVYDVDYYVVTDEDMQFTVNFKAFDYEDDESYLDADEVTYTFVSSNPTLIPVENISLGAYTDEAKLLTIDPAANKFGSAVITIVATDTDGAQTMLDFNVVVTSVNDLPEGNADVAVTDEDNSVTFSVLGNDYDIEDSASELDDLKMTISSISECTNGGVAINAGGGQITYSPPLNYNGSDSLTYTLMDSFGETVVVNVTITINPVNDAPVAVDDEGTVREGEQVVIDLTANDTDVEFDSGEVIGQLAIDSVSGNMAGSAVTFENGSLTYTASDDIIGTVVDEVTYVVTDGELTDTGTVFITVTQVNDPPAAANDEENKMNIEGDSWEFAEDTTGVFVVNITDPDTPIANLLVTIVSDGQAYVEDANIQVSNTPEGNKQVTLVPIENAFGEFTITFTVSDGESEATEYFPVTITPVNDAPVLSVSDITVNEQATANRQATATDIETASEALVYSLASAASHGTAVVNADGSYSYTSDIDYNGSDSFEITVTDEGELTDTKTVNVTVEYVNDAPDAVNDSYTIDESAPATTFDVLANDTDVDIVYTDSLTITNVSTPTHGTAVINNNKIDYTPQQYNNKPVTFTYTITDEHGGTDTATVSVTITAIDNNPANGDDAYTIAEDSGIHYFDVLVNDDVDTDEDLNVLLDTLTLVSVTPTTPANSLVCIVEDNQLKYQPALNFNGTDEVTYVMRDLSGEETYTFTATITVTPVNDAPTISDIADELEGSEDTNIVTSCTVGDVETSVDNLVVSATWNNDTLINSVNITTTGATRTVTVVPEANMSGQAVITVTVKDEGNLVDTDTFTVMFAAVDDTPTPNDHDDTAVTDENTTIYIDVLANDDVDLQCEGDELGIVPGSIEESTDTPYGGTYNIVQRTVQQTLVDANGNEYTVDVTRDVIEFVPVADWTSKTGTDVVVSYTMFETGAEGVTYTATYKLTITVNPVNDAPTIDIQVAGDTEDTDQMTILEDAAEGTGLVTVTINDEEDGNVTLTVSLDSITEDPGNYTPLIPLLLEGGVTISPDTDDTRTMQAVMQADESGIVSITLQVEDFEGLTGTDTLEVTVTPTQDAPTGGDDLFTTDEDTPILLDVLANDDVDQSTQGSLSTVTQIISQPSHGTAVISDNKVLYTPAQDYYNDGAGVGEDDSFVYEMMDGNEATAQFTVTMYVDPVNDAPVLYFVDDEGLADNKISTPEETPRTLTLYVQDVDNAVADIQLTGLSSNTIVVMNSDISITGPVDNSGDAYFTVIATPFLRWNGITNLTFTATDTYARETSGYETQPQSVQVVELTVDSVNQPPEPEADNVTSNEGQTKSFNVIANDYDPDEDTNPDEEDLTVDSVSFSGDDVGTPVGTIEVDGTKNVIFTPAVGYEDWNGVLSFTYTVIDTSGATAEQECTLTVNQVNDAPVAVANAYTISEGQAIGFNPVDNDTDIDMDGDLNADPGAESIWVTADGFSGVYSTNSIEFNFESGTLTYIPDSDFNGVDVFYYTLTDGDTSVQGTITITVNPVEDDPTAVDDTGVTVAEEATVTVDVTGNDSDTDSDALLNLDLGAKNDGSLTVTAVNGTAIAEGETLAVANGSVKLVSNNLEYTGDADFVGSDSFTYTIENMDGRTATATVYVAVTDINDTPTAAPLTDSLTEGAAAQAYDIDTLIDDIDLGNPSSTEELTVTIQSSTYPADISFNSETNIVTFTPKTDFNGDFVITYCVTDKAGAWAENTITVSVAPVEDDPTAVDDTGITVAEEAAVTVDVTDNDSDTDSDALLNLDLGAKNDGSLTVIKVNGTAIAEGETLAVANGSVKLVSNNLEYTGDADFVGNDSFTYTIENYDGRTATATVYVTVTDINDTPTAQAQTDSLTEGDGPQTYDIDNLIDDIDLGNPSSTEELTVTIQSSTYPADISFNSETNIVTFTPKTDFNGDFVITYRVTDKAGAWAESTITVTVAPVEDDPTAVDDTGITVAEEAAVTVDVTDNDSDTDSDALLNLDLGAKNDGSLTVIKVNGTAIAEGETLAVANGSVKLVSNNLEYTGDADFVGNDSFTYTIENYDGRTATATVYVTVNDVNDTPTAQAQTDSLTEGDGPQTYDIDNLIDDVDLGNPSSTEELTVNIISSTYPADISFNSETNIVTFTPKTDFNGDFVITYSVTDKAGAWAENTITVTVAPVEDDPTAVDDNGITVAEEATVTVDVTDNDSDTDSDALLNLDESAKNDGSLTVTAVNGTAIAEGETLAVANGSVKLVSNNLEYTGDADFVGNDSFTYTIENYDGRTATATVYVTVNDVNDTPTAQPLTDTIDEDDPAQTYDIDNLIDDIDLGNPSSTEELTVTIVSSTNPSDISFNGSTNEVTYTPAANYNGSFVITYRVTDKAGAWAENTITVTVTPVGDTPVSNTENLSVDEDEYVSVWGTLDVLANDTDIDETTNPAFEDVQITGLVYDNMTYVDMQIATGGKSLEIKTSADWNGLVTFTYTVTDAYGLTSSVQSTVQVVQVNDAPVAGADSTTTPEDTPVTFNIYDNDSDVDMKDLINENPSGDSITISAVTGAQNGSVSYDSGELTYTPDADFNGTENITYTLSDQHGGVVTGYVTITVTQVYDAPRAQDDTKTALEDTADVVIEVLTNDYNPDSDGDINAEPTSSTLTITGVTSPLPAGCGTVEISGSTLVFHPAANFDGIAQFVYTVQNISGLTDTATVTVTMTGTSDIPTAQDAAKEVFEDSSIDVDMSGYISDPDDEVLTVSITADCGHGTASVSSNVITYTPDPNYNGTDSIGYTVTDEQNNTASATLSITVKQVNDTPVVLPDSAEGTEDSAVTILVLANDSDIDTVELLNASPDDEWLEIDPNGFTGVENGTAAVVSGTVVFTPAANWHGIEVFEYTAMDQSGVKVKGTVTVTIAPVNDVPAAVAGYDNELLEDDSITFEASDLVFDPDINSNGDVVTYSIVTQSENGTVTIGSGDVIKYVPKANFNGSDSFTLKAVDSEGKELVVVIELHISQVNDKPVVKDDTASCKEDGSVEIDVLANDSDIDMNTSLNEFPKKESLSIVPGSFDGLENGSVEIVDNKLVYTPDNDFYGEEVFTYTIRDAKGRTAQATVVVSVESVLDVPVLIEFTSPEKGSAYKSGQEVAAVWTVDNPESVKLVYTLEFFDGQEWKTIGEGLSAREFKYLVEEYITQTDEAQFAVVGYYDGTATNKVYSDKFIIDNVAPVDTQYDVAGGEKEVTISLGNSVDMLSFKYVYSIDGGSEMIDAVDGRIVVDASVKTVTLYAVDELGNITEVGTVTIADELLAAGVASGAGGLGGLGNFEQYWYMVLIAGVLLAMLLFAAFYRNIIFEFVYADGSTKTVKLFRAYKEQGISVRLNEKHFDGAQGVTMTMKERITGKMKDNTVSVYMDNLHVKSVEIPGNASGRFEDTIA